MARRRVIIDFSAYPDFKLSTIVHADEIIVLEAGRIVERGTHLALLQQNGLYASMWNRQREAEAARETLALAGETEAAPNRNPPPVEDEINAAANLASARSPVDAVETFERSGLPHLALGRFLISKK